MQNDPIHKSKAQHQEIIDKIAVAESPVGIDAQLTHAIIIEYLQGLHSRLDRIEAALNLK
jgi:hypothetical protein